MPCKCGKTHQETIMTRTDIPGLLDGPRSMVELGVARGAFSAQLLAKHKDLHLTMVDRWAGDRGHTDTQMAEARNAVWKWRNRAKIVKSTFEDYARKVPNETYDIVYLDGYAHTGQEGGVTLEQWWPKVVKGGLFCGHDYCERWRPTMDAVDSFVKRHRIKDLQTTDEDHFPSWFIFK